MAEKRKKKNWQTYRNIVDLYIFWPISQNITTQNKPVGEEKDPKLRVATDMEESVASGDLNCVVLVR
ncbi:hypothetical protein N9296_03785 [Amylibacter sp.]|nr:hypothetical protein [Amylibacter sp.]|tara:strand:- start:346 stop:546 length:201 start_codon:yes stop_codon:yes gene_type:complete